MGGRCRGPILLLPSSHHPAVNRLPPNNRRLLEPMPKTRSMLSSLAIRATPLSVRCSVTIVRSVVARTWLYGGGAATCWERRSHSPDFSLLSLFCWKPHLEHTKTNSACVCHFIGTAPLYGGLGDTFWDTSRMESLDAHQWKSRHSSSLCLIVVINHLLVRHVFECQCTSTISPQMAIAGTLHIGGSHECWFHQCLLYLPIGCNCHGCVRCSRHSSLHLHCYTKESQIRFESMGGRIVLVRCGLFDGGFCGSVVVVCCWHTHHPPSLASPLLTCSVVPLRLLLVVFLFRCGLIFVVYGLIQLLSMVGILPTGLLPYHETLYGLFGACLFSFYLAYHTKLIVAGKHSKYQMNEKDYVFGASTCCVLLCVAVCHEQRTGCLFRRRVESVARTVGFGCMYGLRRIVEVSHSPAPSLFFILLAF